MPEHDARYLRTPENIKFLSRAMQTTIAVIIGVVDIARRHSLLKSSNGRTGLLRTAA